MFIECEIRQLNKYGEELCGDNADIVRNDNNTVIVLSDGLGSGVKANILSTLTKKIASTMLSNGMEIEEVVETLINTLPICQARKMAYSTFSIIQIFDNNEVTLVEFDNPAAYFIHNGRITQYESTNVNISGKDIKISKFKLSKGDFLVLISDGMIHAGLGGLIRLGWSWEKIGNFLQRNVDEEMSASVIAEKLIFIANELYQGKIGDDTSVVVVKARDKRYLTIAVGPPVDKLNDCEMVNHFLHSPGKKIICGGTTANIVAKTLNTEIKVVLDKSKSNVPPKGEISGIDLVTEGIITLSKTVDILDIIKEHDIRRNQSSLQNIYALYGAKDSTQAVLDKMTEKVDYEPQNPAEELALELHKADSIKFIVGRAINPAHQNPDFPVQSGLKFKIIKELMEKLETNGKEIEVEYY
jgi:serine/threonine protein phosphatase PrpC